MPPVRPVPSRARATPFATRVAACALLVAGGCGEGVSPPAIDVPSKAEAARPPGCDDGRIAAALAAEGDARLLLTRAFAPGEPLLLAGTPTATTPVATAGVCLVKLVVGPARPGPIDAPSTSAGIGIEVWLPTPHAWNGRVHALGGGGWQGGAHTFPDAIGHPPAARIAMEEGAVSSHTDTGHPGTSSGGAFAMDPAGAIDRALWTDFAHRAVHEQARKTKAVATAYYGRAPTRAYFEGGSTGGRQGLVAAHRHPEDWDGIVADYPAIGWTRFALASLNPQVVYRRDLHGAPLTREQYDRMGDAAIDACNAEAGTRLDFLLDPSSCRYDPTRDATVLCAGAAGRSGVVGTATGPGCVDLAGARAMNAIWYGPTADGEAPDPALDNGWATGPADASRGRGLARGTAGFTPGGIAGPIPSTFATDMIALVLQDPTLASGRFVNATGRGADGWTGVDHAGLADALERATALQPAFGEVDGDDPDLAAFAARGGRIVGWHGLNDELIPAQGTVRHYRRVAERLGGLRAAREVWRLYLVPGLGHSTANGTTRAGASIPVIAPTQSYDLLVAWVERGVEPGTIGLVTPWSTPIRRTMPGCAYPERIVHVGGDPDTASSYACREPADGPVPDGAGHDLRRQTPVPAVAGGEPR